MRNQWQSFVERYNACMACHPAHCSVAKWYPKHVINSCKGLIELVVIQKTTYCLECSLILQLVKFGAPTKLGYHASLKSQPYKSTAHYSLGGSSQPLPFKKISLIRLFMIIYSICLDDRWGYFLSSFVADLLIAVLIITSLLELPKIVLRLKVWLAKKGKTHAVWPFPLGE